MCRAAGLTLWVLVLAGSSTTLAQPSASSPEISPVESRSAARHADDPPLEQRPPAQLVLADLWMNYVADREAARLADFPWVAGFVGAEGLLWALAAGASVADHSPIQQAIVCAGGSALSLTAAAFTLTIEDPQLRYDFGVWGTLLLQPVILAGFLGARATAADCTGDCSYVMGSVGAMFLLQGIGWMIGQLAFPEPYVSTSVGRYRALPAGERAAFAQELLLRHDTIVRHRSIYQYVVAMSIAAGGAVAATQVDTDRGRIALAAFAASFALTATINLLLWAVNPAPSEQLMRAVSHLT